MDIFGGQVGRPENASAFALVEMDGNGEFTLRNIGVGRGFVELNGAAAIAADRVFTKRDIDAIGIDLRAGVTDGGGKRPQLGSQPAQAVLTRGECAIAFATRSASASLGRALNVQFDHVGDSLAVSDDLPRE